MTDTRDDTNTAMSPQEVYSRLSESDKAIVSAMLNMSYALLQSVSKAQSNEKKGA